MKRVAVIGGGFAGLSAAAELAARGFAVALFEARPRLGGRAYSFRDEESGEVVDNGQHALMGCYRDTLAFLDRIGAASKLTRQPNLRVSMVHPQRGAGTIAAASLPSPLHLLAGLVRYRLLTPAERCNALFAGLRIMAMRRRQDPRLREWTVAELLRALGQSVNARASFWYPVAIATLNESPDRAAAVLFAEVLKRAFFQSRDDSQFVLPNVGLSEFYTEDARRYVEARGGRVELKAQVTALAIVEGRVTGLRLRDGHYIETDACVSAVPPKTLATFLPDTLRHRCGLEELDRFETSPIISAHLWFDRPVLPEAFVGLVGRTTQWLFDRSQLTGRSENGTGRHAVSAVISAGRDIVDWPSARIADQVITDTRALLPSARAAQVLQSVVVKEKQATISPSPAAERLRPGAVTPLDNFFLAGDWIGTGLPPTIESAVCSGRRAAELVADCLARKAAPQTPASAVLEVA